MNEDKKWAIERALQRHLARRLEMQLDATYGIDVDRYDVCGLRVRSGIEEIAEALDKEITQLELDDYLERRIEYRGLFIYQIDYRQVKEWKNTNSES